jgi:L-alanine-DL-glutamate epimerase-like enolase superfamily enzyme
MEITDVSATPVVLPTEGSVEASSYSKAGRGTTMVTLETDGDVTGYVNSGDILDSNPERAGTLKTHIEEHVAPVVVGQDLFATERGWEEAFAKSSQFSAYNYDARQLFVHALGAVDIARWDAVGKATGQPLYKLWGGYRDSLPIIAIGGYYKEGGDDDLRTDVEEYQRLGFGGLKLKVGGRSVERDLERLAVVAETADDGFEIMCDANQGYSVAEAVEFAETARAYDVQWFEEPVAWYDQYAGMREVRQRTGIPVTAGQSESAASACRRLIEEEAVDVINMDASIAGGPTQWRKVARMAELHGVSMAHHEEPQISMHLLASIPNGLYAEAFHPSVDPVWFDLVTERPEISDGTIDLPDAPGLGVEYDESLIEAHAVDV